MSSDQSSGEDPRRTERLFNEDPLTAADRAEFWAWWRLQWPRRTWFGKLKLVVMTIVLSWMFGCITVMSYLDRHWPDTYKEDEDAN
ncbi:hypothetical protein [Halorubrum sp. CBA1229]|uniref:hypothetical protein n=1 Tax=Halorubrum sp. CBA1229 TaxID=1853699 RepID=UPI000F4012CF|nr:hypothetical protein [Halorubrum sp. CBA1229]QKY18315.1 hypothetical protein Hrr1229_016025 [Halorubrum sp. CBA1229]